MKNFKVKFWLQNKGKIKIKRIKFFSNGPNIAKIQNFGPNLDHLM
jgi:hypothetical protein